MRVGFTDQNTSKMVPVADPHCPLGLRILRKETGFRFLLPADPLQSAAVARPTGVGSEGAAAGRALTLVENPYTLYRSTENLALGCGRLGEADPHLEPGT